ncbi:FAD-dependent monooxygenase [Gimesia aquarii]|uniref:Pentachlorophenol 4-monooxygenase n=1 Tax=Gimesia aquarii TaxID=2527964 RepID=A0A517VV03_9PLAN|nr:FAD-dependent monooxygenase [Gimesia aquarii]QDT96826.1 Pentachlorophenol 4-monooxygenase [Gimesia aquarii]
MNTEISLPQNIPVLIVGAGPTGLSLAVELARRQIDCLLVDRRPEPLPLDRATVIHSRSLEVLESMGILESFLQRGHIMHGFNLFAYGQKIATVKFDSLDCRHPYDLNLSENETEDILTNRLIELGGAVTRGWELSKIEQTETEVKASLRATDGTEHTVTSNWLVGADGIHSRVREAIGIEIAGHRYPVQWGVIDGHLKNWQHEPDLAAIQLENPALNPVPLPEGRWRVYFRADDNTGSAEILESINQGLDQLSPGASLVEPDQSMLYHAHCQLSGHYRSNRVLLAGDAAHACSPIEGHGMNTGIQDSFNLGWKLALVANGKANKNLLDSYELERRPVAAAVAATGDAAEELRDVPNDPTAVERVKRTFCAILCSSRGQNQVALDESELEFHYRDSPIVSGYHSAGREAQQKWLGVLPGDRIPDAGPLEMRADKTEIRLNQLSQTEGHVLLWMSADQSDIPERGEFETAMQPIGGSFWIISTTPPPDTISLSTMMDHWLYDIDGDVHARLGVIDPTLFVIRPDGHVAFRSEPPDLANVSCFIDELLTQGRLS